MVAPNKNIGKKMHLWSINANQSAKKGNNRLGSRHLLGEPTSSKVL